MYNSELNLSLGWTTTEGDGVGVGVGVGRDASEHDATWTQAKGSSFSTSSTWSNSWLDSEPLWATASRTGVKVALFHWLGCEEPFEDSPLPYYCVPPPTPPPPTPRFLHTHLHHALHLIQTEGVRLAMVYEGSVGWQGEQNGPNSVEVEMAVSGVDAALEGLWDALVLRHMVNTTDVLVLSDHGLTLTSDLTPVDVTPCLMTPGEVQLGVGQGGYLNLAPSPITTPQQVAGSVRECGGKGGVMEKMVEVYVRENIPYDYHYQDHQHILPVLVIARTGYSLQPLHSKQEGFSQGTSVGTCGYDNIGHNNPDMRGIILATGPSFRKGVEVGGMSTVDVYGVCGSDLEGEVLDKIISVHLALYPSTPQSAKTWGEPQLTGIKLAATLVRQKKQSNILTTF
ncbi:hypothetical protein Pmani_010133 [Petrolisthes manimaculis]|uniref:Uncharacterized protein n=1 Tax=Petrolisthes manimaculis TaxID=1843537 RepID=A0AAE1Q3N9_9EUCA|nr:hypothetical protein Pmani_010133 [Petrolisthes manimaculis]